jgi:hypothetical protein
MGIEFFLLILLAIGAVAGAIFALGSFSAAKTAPDDEGDGRRPTHVYVENETEGKHFGDDSTEHVRRGAEEDPETELRLSR